MKGYLDRFEENEYAVILVEELKKEFVLRKEELPEGSTVQTYFDLTIENDEIKSIKLDPGITHTEQQNVKALMAKLRAKSNGSKFKK